MTMDLDTDFVISAVNAGVDLTLLPRGAAAAGQVAVTRLVADTVHAGTDGLVVGASVTVRMR